MDIRKIALFRGAFMGYSPSGGMLEVRIPWVEGKDGVDNPIFLESCFHKKRDHTSNEGGLFKKLNKYY
jgi:hypothetical protein